MKETFIIRTEWWNAISELDEKGQSVIFRLLFLYHLGEPIENLINLNNLTVKLVWKLIEPNLKRNIDAYNDKRSETSVQNGKLGGRPKKLNNLNKPNKPNKPLSVSVSVSDSVNVKDNVKVTVNENEKLISEHGKELTEKIYQYLSDYKREKNYKTKSDYLTIKRWVIDAVKKTNSNPNFKNNKLAEHDPYANPNVLK